jgi:hypothetical protein
VMMTQLHPSEHLDMWAAVRAQVYKALSAE